MLLALQRAETLQSLAWLFNANLTFAKQLDEAGFLHLLFEPLLKAVIALFTVFVGLNRHKDKDSAPAGRHVPRSPKGEVGSQSEGWGILGEQKAGSKGNLYVTS